MEAFMFFAAMACPVIAATFIILGVSNWNCPYDE